MSRRAQSPAPANRQRRSPDSTAVTSPSLLVSSTSPVRWISWVRKANVDAHLLERLGDCGLAAEDLLAGAAIPHGPTGRSRARWPARDRFIVGVGMMHGHWKSPDELQRKA